MTDTPRQLEEDDTPEPQAGERLAAARRARDISLRDIAKELHLDEPKVQALEDNRFEVLGAPVFAKGHLRKYAELVGVSADDVLADYYQLNRSAGAPPLVGLRRHEAGGRHIVRWLFIAIVVIAVVGVAFWWFTRQPAPPAPAAAAATVTMPTPAGPEPGTLERDVNAAEENTTAAVEDPPHADDDVVPEPPAQQASVEPEPTVLENPAEAEPQITETAAVEGQVELRLAYTGDCWTEVTDATGRRLFFDLGSAGRVVTVSGVPPLQVLLGVSDNVSVAVDGLDYVIRNTELRGNNTARLTIRGR